MRASPEVHCDTHRTENREWFWWQGPEFLRTKKGLSPLDSKPSVLKGWQLSFPEGQGIDWVEPSFASLKRNPSASVHGVATLFTVQDAEKLNNMEPPNIQWSKALLYDGHTELDVEIYLSRKELPLDHPEGACSGEFRDAQYTLRPVAHDALSRWCADSTSAPRTERYRDILVKGAEEMLLDMSWIDKLRALPVYAPSAETLALRAAVPSSGNLPAMTVQELAEHDG